MALTPGQQACVDSLVGPVAVSAGAGSGKTFTLTRRIVHALESGFVGSVDEVLAITFTSKAAGEIKSRVKGALKACGRTDQALLVDSAWISTIHGACSRILRAHALELGIAPDFAVADEALSRTLLDEALEEVLGAENDLVSPQGLDALFEEYPARSAGPLSGGSVEDAVRALVSAASASPDGMDSLVLPPKTLGPVLLVQQMIDAAGEMLALAERQKESKSRDAFLDATREACERAEAAQVAGGPCAGEVLSLLNAFPPPARNFGDKEYKDRAAEALQTYYAIMMEARMAQADPLLAGLLSLASEVLAAYRRRKRELGVLDNDDLLTLASRAFSDHPAIASAYADRFKLIMVDEFQDTDQVQVDMVKRLAGEGFSRLCTVGDAQQSIYRFRGADVSVYNRHLDAVRESNPQGLITLSDNFRSHVDVLAFVDCVFSQPSVFGRSFMSLAPARDEARVSRPFLEDGPRIEVQLTTYPHAGVGSEAAAKRAAERIAARFAELAAAGHRAGDMVVLLGGMRRADVYADALRQAGLPCVVAGGSVFNGAPEVSLVVRLAEVIANPKDSQALFEVLSSELFALSADDLLELSTGYDEVHGVPRRIALDVGFSRVAKRIDEGWEAPCALACAVGVLRRAVDGAGRLPLSRLLSQVAVDSGWLSRLEADGAQGLARAANVHKAIRVAEGIERAQGLGLAGTARALVERVALAKEAPGALSAKDSDFVRIMTIHASKGLEFPIVAVAEMRADGERSGKLCMASIGGRTHLSLDAGRSFSALAERQSSLAAKSSQFAPFAEAEEDQVEAVISNAGENGASAGEVRAAIKLHEQWGEASEARRLLYVALTRAKEALLVAAVGKRTKNDASGLSKNAFGSIESALCGEGCFFEEGVTMRDFGGLRSARIERVDLLPESAEEASACADAALSECDAASEEKGAAPFVDIPKVEAFSERADVALPPARQGVFSYSSLAASDDAPAGEGAHDGEGAHEDVPAGELPEPSEDDAVWAAIAASLLGDADKATSLGSAFHRAAQYSADAHAPGELLAAPPQSRIDALARSYRLTHEQRARLRSALDRWFSSEMARRVASFADVRAEVPFFVALGGEGTSNDAGEGAGAQVPFLEGAIDLFAADDKATCAFVVDYKTGGSPYEAPERLHRKHLLQAQCYAYAVLKQGFSRVDLAFVRVEQPAAGSQGEPQTVEYSFEARDLPALEQAIAGHIA